MSESYPCRGGCGKYMPQGQRCFDCAVKSVETWKLSKVVTLAIPDKRKRRV